MRLPVCHWLSRVVLKESEPLARLTGSVNRAEGAQCFLNSLTDAANSVYDDG